MENDLTLPDNVKELVKLIKSRADESNTEEELFGLTVASSFDCDGEICDELIDHMIEYIKGTPDAGIRELLEHLTDILPPVEIIEDEESA